ncbi:DUF397 domain-containing protein [Amycolatopsis sp. cmx-8-4]|uniref:DUF397 domain-containing protein n=1 Tax=Amycolatopsis sp. cmx-8-4 TaxID=2790947 RepID=UPI00397C5F79
MKSSASGSGGGGDGNCVEVARTPSHVHLRDSKNPDPRLTFTRETWRAFLHSHL